MKKLHRLYEETTNFNKKMQYLKNFCKVMSEFIETFNSYDLDNDTVFEKYYLYLQGLFESYNIYFSKINNEQNNDKQFQKEVLKKIINYFSKISAIDSNSYYLKNLLEKLKGINNEMFQELVINVMGIMTVKVRGILKTNLKWPRYKAKIIFSDVLNIIEMSIIFILKKETTMKKL